MGRLTPIRMGYVAVLMTAACNSPRVEPPPSTATTPSSPATAYPTPDLNSRPLVWFAPLPPLPFAPGRQFSGSEDYADLFLPGAPWQEAMHRIHVFEVYGGWVPYSPGTSYADWQRQLTNLVGFVSQRGIALAMEHSPIDRPADCGTDRESWGGLEANLEAARVIQRLGGTLHFVVMDAPYYYTSLVAYPGACQWPAEQVAQAIEAYMQGMKSIFPDVVIGDAEPLQADLSPTVYMDWMTTFRAVTGHDLGFFHMDIDYARPDWGRSVKELEDFAREEGIDFGIFYFGNWDDLTDEAWLSSAGERVKHYEIEIGGRPDHVLFQSWHDHPDHNLPETEPFTHTQFINQYFEAKSQLGFRPEGPGANVAFGKTARASRSLTERPPANAVDGNPGTAWGAGDFPPNWIEIDLGQPYAVREIRLRLDQGELVGFTTHVVSVRGPGTDGQLVPLQTFDQETSDLDQLVVTLPQPLEGIQFVRLTITRSPSWVGVREIEVIAAR